LFDSLNGVTGPFSRRIFVGELGASENCLQNSIPLPDFGGSHPDPNLVNAAQLVKRMNSKEEKIDFGVAWDGDGDRNMILGHNFFVTPSDSVAIIAAHATSIPFYKEGLKAVSRSMPTNCALDRVAAKLEIPSYEVPTGWKFFGNLMDKYEIEGSQGFICGEESFGTGSSHIREKDGTWAALCWLSILAFKNPETYNITVEDIVRQHWLQYGRNYYSRYDYENVSSESANKLMKHMVDLMSIFKPGDKLGDFVIRLTDEFEYKDPVDQSISPHQGIRYIFEGGSRFVIRLSGTGSSGATIRLYVEKYEEKNCNLETAEALRSIIQLALNTMKIKEFIGTEIPTVIT